LGKHRPASHLIEDDVQKALATLRSGKAVYLRAYGDNLPRLRTLVKGGGDAHDARMGSGGF